jgi:hypothetical protein
MVKEAVIAIMWGQTGLLRRFLLLATAALLLLLYVIAAAAAAAAHPEHGYDHWHMVR